jgi:TfoX/Sxy family transcriptional regulator of competence genes
VEAITERLMFGGLALMLGGHMFCGVVKDTLMVRLGARAPEEALSRPYVRPMDFTGGSMKGMAFVEPGGLRGAALRRWVEAAAKHTRGPPSKPSPGRGRSRQ